MKKVDRSCFVIMPFQEEFHYFYLYMKQHIEKKHGVDCIRGDADVLDVPLLEKIRAYIEQADVLIADCSNRNPNVFYELGMAHTLGKRVILITRDTAEEAPSDIRHYEFIRYTPTRDEDFFKSLDKALRAVFVDRYDDLHELASTLFQEFKISAKGKAKIIDKQEFIEAMISAEQSRELPDFDDLEGLREFLLPRIVANKHEKEVISALAHWYESSLEMDITKISAKQVI